MGVAAEAQTERHVVLATKASSMPDQARALRVTGAADFTRAAEFLKDVKALRKEIDDTFADPIAAAHRAHKAALAAKQRCDEPLAIAEHIVKQAIGAYQAAEERRRREAEARLREETRRIEEAARLKEAEALEAAGEHRAAEAVIDAPLIAPAVVLPSAAPRVAGVSSRVAYTFRIVDAALIPREWLIPDEKEIRAYVRRKGADAKIPGVEVLEERVVSARAGF